MDFAASAFDIKALDESGSIEGLLAGFNNIDSHGDVIAPGAFAKTLAARGGRPLPMLLHHDKARPIGAWTAWQEKAEGLYVKGAMTLSVRDAQEAHALAKAGALSGLSIGYRPKLARPDRGQNLLLELDLYEGSLVAVPSNPKTHVSAVKAIVGARDIEDLLRAGGLSGRQAKHAASAAWRSINMTNDDEQGDATLARVLAASAARIGFGKDRA